MIQMLAVEEFLLKVRVSGVRCPDHFPFHQYMRPASLNSVCK